MTILGTDLPDIHRPLLLIRAAEEGFAAYDRRLALRRLIGDASPRPPAEAASRLRQLEAEAETRRIADAEGYSILRHVEILVALLGETRLARH